MKKKIIQILIWIGLMFAGTILAAMVWQAIFHGSVSINSQKWLQFFSVIGMFVMPPLVCAYMWDEDKRPERWLKMDCGTHWSNYVLAACLMIVAIPAINLLADWNSRISLPDHLVQSELDAEVLLRAFLQADNAGMILVNIGLLALLPAIAEELTFRGTLQQILSHDARSKMQVHIAIWVSAIIFSAIHMQFMGFIPRMLMGAMFGYMFVWTGTIWIPVVMHFTNNAIGVLAYSLLPENSIADTIGAGNTWYVGAISMVITCLGLLIFYRRTRTQ